MRRAVSMVLCLALLAAAGMAMANVPDPQQSTFDSRLGRSPKNIEVNDPNFDYTFSGTLRNAAGQPVANWPANDIELEINAPCQNPVVLNPSGPSDANGNVLWNASRLDQGGGSCIGTAVVEIRLVSVGLFRTLNEVTSPDENGNAVVALEDLSVFQGAFVNGSPQYQGDLNLSGGLPDLADLSFFQKHFVAP
jgi:hypothetical protein